MKRLILLIAALSLLVACGGGSDSKLKVGDEAILQSPSGGTVVVGISEYALGDYFIAANANDEVGGLQLLQSGRIYFEKSGTRLLILDSPSDSVYKVRLITGDHYGEVGYTLQPLCDVLPPDAIKYNP